MAAYTKHDIATITESSVRTIKEDSQYLTKEGLIEPIRANGEANQYSESDLEIFRQLREHCEAGYARKSFIPTKKTEIVPTEPELSQEVATAQQVLTTEHFRQIFTNLCHTDLLFDYEQLQRCAEKQWYLPTAKLAVIINKKPASFCHLQIFLYQGFRISRLPQKEGKSYLWSVASNY